MSNKDILQAFGERLIAGLQRKAVASPSRWAQEYARSADGAPISYRKYPWQREMLDSKASHNVAAKGAQLGISRMALLRGMCANDLEHRDVLYILPNMHPLGSNFSNTRFDTEVACSPYLRSIYDRSNVGLKRTSTNAFYIGGAQSKSSGKSVPAGFLIVDEIDEVPRWFLPLVRERMSGQDLKTEWDISTPTIPEHGISKLWDESTQEHFCFPCPHCSTSAANGTTQGKLIHLTYPECLEVVGDDPDSPQVLHDSYLKCPDCGGRLEHADKPNLFRDAHFYPMVANKEKRGFHVNQLYSATVTPGEVAAAALRAQFSEIESQEFWNSKMGKAHSTSGSKLSEAQIEVCKGSHLNDAPPTEGYFLRTMGVDVGSRLHYEICEWWVGEIVGDDPCSASFPTVVKCGFVQDPMQLDAMMADYQINMCVIDAMPETRMAFAFSQRWQGHVRMCYYAQGVAGKMLTETSWDHGEPIVNVNRTTWLDQSLGRVRAGQIRFPADLPFEYVEHMKTPMRVWSRDHHGNPIVSYKTPEGKADHHAHARNYAEIALPLALGVGVHQAIRGPYG